MANEKRLYGLGEVCAKLGVAEYAVHRLFRDGKLRRDDFQQVSGRRLFTEAQVRQIAKLLSDK